MKKTSVVTILSIVLFLLVAMAAVFMTQPLYNRLTKEIYKYSTALENKVTELTGLEVSYESFSPSILSGFNIKGVKLADKENENVVFVKNVKIAYKFSSLLKKNYSAFVRNVSVNGVEISLDKLIEVFSHIPSDNNGNQVDFQTILSYVPDNVSFKDIFLTYENEFVSAELGIKDTGIFNAMRNDKIDFQLNGNARIYIKQSDKTATGDVYLNGSVLSGIDNSSVYVSLSDLTDGEISLNKLNLLASYTDNEIEVHTVQSVNPFSVRASYNLESKLVSVKVDSEKLNPMSVVNFAGKSDAVKTLKDIRCSISAEASMKADGENALNSLMYSSSGSVSLPSSIIPDGVVVSYDVYGDTKKINLSKITINGNRCSGDGNLAFIFDSFRLDGVANLTKYVLPNGCELSTEIYFDHLDRGFMAFSPQIFIGEQALTAFQAKVLPQTDSIDFEMEVSDYSHLSATEPGVISLNGSYLTASNFMQASVGFTSVYVQSILKIVEQCMPSENVKNLKGVDDFAEPFMFTGEVFASTDFSSVSYNVPYLVMANTEKENQLLFLSVNGNNQTVQCDRFDLIYGKLGVNASLGIDFSSKTNTSFYMDAVSSSIPYHLQGSFNNKSVKVAGDYGMDIEVNFDKNKNITGSALLENLPLVYEKIGIILSTDAYFSYSEENGPELQILRFVVEENNADSAQSPKLTFSGSGTKYGMQLKSISYTDTYSNLEGAADIALSMTGNIFESAAVTASLKDITNSGEEINLDASVFNSDAKPLDAKTIMDSLYVNAMAEIKHFSLNRFMSVKNSNNEITATLSVSGTPENPYASANVQKLSFLMNNELVNANGSVILEDMELTIKDFGINQSFWSFKNINGDFSLKKMTGKMSADFETAGQKNMLIPMELSLEDSYVPEGKFIPENMIIKLSSSGISGSLMKKTVPFDITAIYSPDFISFYSSENLGVTGSFTKTDGLYASLNVKDMADATVKGIFEGNNLNISISDAYADLNKLVGYFDVDEYFTIKTGILNGNFSMLGTYDTPEFMGMLSASNMDFSLPTVLGENIHSELFTIRARENEFEIPENTFKIGKNNEVTADAKVIMNKWVMDNLSMHLATKDKKVIPLKLKTPMLSVSGDINCDLNLGLEDSILDLSGSISGEKINILSSLKDLTGSSTEDKAKNENSTKTNEFYFRTSLDVFLGTHVMLNIDPLIRCIFVPNTKLKINMDSITQNYEIDGKLNIKSGDVAYVNRSFYIKEGSVKFNPSEIANPQISLRAETREKDEKGENIRIILSADNQYLQDFQPKFSSIPAKSENEIYLLLGQVVIADLNDVGTKTTEGKTEGVVTDLLATAGDYYIQSMATRKLENALRESLNFDIFSLRTNVLQYYANRINYNKPDTESISVGNFVDISTVYIGKYLGSAMYVDAMLNLSSKGGSTDRGDLILQPEIGFEFELPFTNSSWRAVQNLDANFRFGLAGENILGGSDNVFDSITPSLSLSLLWRF